MFIDISVVLTWAESSVFLFDEKEGRHVGVAKLGVVIQPHHYIIM